jgi:hypothetical protein
MDNNKPHRFLPLDLPLFEDKQAVLDTFDGNMEESYWHKEELTERDRSIPFGAIPAPFTQEALRKYPTLIEYITTHWPIKEYVYVTLMRANRDVQPHVDGNFLDDKGPVNRYNTITPEYYEHQWITEPCGYRMLLKGSRSNLYLCDTYDPTYKKKDWEGLNKQYCVIPEDTDCFALQTNDSPHGADYTEDDDDRLLLFAVGWIDVDQHYALIEKSERRYGRF